MKKAIIGAFVLVMSLSSAGHAIFLPDPSTNAFQYGDFYSYSLPILAWQYDQQFGGGVGPGNPYYVPSSPGQISDLIVVATGSSGGPVTTNFPGMNDAYPTPSGQNGSPLFSTENTPNPDNNPLTGYDETWNSTLAAFTGFLGGTTPVFFFNNNQENSGGAENQTLFAWGQMLIIDSDTGAAPIVFDFTDLTPNGFGGIPGGDVTTYNSPGPATSLYPYVGGSGTWPAYDDFVLSGGQVTIDWDGPGGNAPVVYNHNLGANQVAYAITSPELNAFLTSWLNGGFAAYDAISIDLRFFGLNNGYEQLFIAKADYTPPVPEPSTFALLGAGLLGLGYVARRRSRK